MGERTPRHYGAPGAPAFGKDAFHRVPDSARDEWDAVERVLTISGGWSGLGGDALANSQARRLRYFVTGPALIHTYGCFQLASVWVWR